MALRARNVSGSFPGFYFPFLRAPDLKFDTRFTTVSANSLVNNKIFEDQIDCKAGTTAEGQNLLAYISTSRTSLLQGQFLIQEK